VVVGVPPPNRTSYNLSDDITAELNVPVVSLEGRNETERRSAMLEKSRSGTPDPPMDSSGGSVSGQQTDTPETSGTEEVVRRSSVRVLRGILKKPRKSREIKVQEIEEIRTHHDQINGESPIIDESIVPEISSQHSDDEQAQKHDLSVASPTKPENNLSSYSLRRGSLQMAAFDRMLFAKRGAQLRDEYLRDGQNDVDPV